MKPLSELGTAKLCWIQPTLKRNYELRADKDIFATLTFETTFGLLATAKSTEGIWIFDQTGFFKPRVMVRERGAESNLLVYPLERSSPELVFDLVESETYVWRLANFLATKVLWIVMGLENGFRFEELRKSCY